MSGLIVPCITLPQDHILQRTLMSCASLPKTLNLVTLTHPHAVPLHHHIVSMNLIPCIMLMTTVVINKVALAAALAATLVVAHPVVVSITMTATVVIPLILATTTSLGIMISPPALQKPVLITKLANIAVMMEQLSHMDIGQANIPVIL